MCLYSVLGLCLLAYKNLSERLDLHIWHYYSGLHLMSFTENSSQGLNTIKQVPNFIKYTGNIIKILKALMLTKLCGYILEVKYNVRFNDCLQRWEGLSGTTLLKYVCRQVAFAVFCSNYDTTLLISLSYQQNFVKLSTFHSSFYIRSHLRAIEFEFWSLSGFTRGHQIFVMIIRARWHYVDETKWMHGPKECTWEDVGIFRSECLAERLQLDQNWNQRRLQKAKL